LKLGLFKLAQIKSTCLAINQSNIDIYKNYSNSDIDKLLTKVDYLKVDDIKVDLDFIQKIETSRKTYKGNNSNQINYFINLDNGYEKYIEAMKSKYKKELRREVRRFYEAFETVELVYFNQQNEVAHFMSDMQIIHKKSWKHGTLNELETDTLNELVDKRQWLGAILYGNGNPISYMHGILNTDDEYLLIKNGYDDSAKHLKPGKVLISKIIENHMKFKIKSIDFGSGSSVYKKIFCNDANDIYSSLITHKRSKYAFLFQVQTWLDTFYLIVKRTSEKLNLDHKLRTIVRTIVRKS
jgi:CelD/BcsL family acetyltransferase involved in cellulose biosynthesis